MGAALLVRSRAAVALRWRPEWKAALVVAAAWPLLLLADYVARPATPDAHDMHAMPGIGEPGTHDGGVLAALPGWALMSIAMMGPVTLRAVGYVGRNSIRRRRNRAMALYFVAYVSVWVGLGVVLLSAGWLARDALGADARTLLAGTLAAAAAWQLSRGKRRAMFACGRTVALPPVGTRADAACVRFAWLEGMRCIRSCWALMAVMAAVGHSGFGWMAGLTALVVLEELTLVGRRLLRPTAAALALAALVVAAGA